MESISGVNISDGWLEVLGAVYLLSAIPVAWAIIDVLRRPNWQFSPGRKVAWGLMLGFGFFVLPLWPVVMLISLVYLLGVRRRLPPVTAGPDAQRPPPQQAWGPQAGGWPPNPQPPGPPWSTPAAGRVPPSMPGPYGQPPTAAEPPRPTPRDLPVAGWYPDPGGSGAQRWWDGVGWTHHTR